ncbi:pectate lyase family protein [Carboxylicivirga litoralis]|uniref:pectate lyase family protein n=1 Tax=Carboxylicivirga litoralis TaxID=2816963 RepID=UPI0021CB3BCD|nr:pectate lyase [Carboxylicivirga sp. A043]
MKVLLQYSLLIIFVLAMINCSQAQKVVAFPGAEGAGKYTTGGRGGMVYTVTNLNDDGPGSLRDGIQKKGPRIIVFAVNGYIDLKSRLDINNDHVTIAGQTAPGDGICIRGYGLRINANNVIIRYLRIRPGDMAHIELDALTGMRKKDIMVDHCSLSWATDEVCSLYDNDNLTLQWCIISESLNKSYHSKGEHGYGGIWGGMKATFHHNLLAHHTSRNPRLQGSRNQSTPETERAEIVNNVIYNWGFKCMYAGEAGNYSICNNYFKAGPGTRKSATKRLLEPYEPYSNYHFDGNVLHGDNSITNNNLLGVQIDKDSAQHYFSKRLQLVSDYTIESTHKAYDKVLKQAGANLVRDAIDKRIVDEVKEGKTTYGTNGIINSQTEVGGWPEIRLAKAPLDSDKDGMPDEWELKQGLNPEDKTDANKYAIESQYTNIESYLNSLSKF